MNSQISFKKYLLICSIGFGIGGMIWGGWLFKIVSHNKDYLMTPFLLQTSLIVGLMGGLALAWFSNNIKYIIKNGLLGMIGFIIGGMVGSFITYFIFIISTTSLRVITRFFATDVDVNNFLNFKSTLLVGDIWLSFCIAGFIIGAFYALGLKTKIWPMVWRGGIGFGLGSLLGPIIGNLFGNLFNSLLASYLIAFAVIGAILGLFLAWGAYINIKNQKSKLQTKI